MRRTTVVLAAIAFCAVCSAVYADYSVGDEGTSPKSRPEELEPLRKQSRSSEGFQVKIPLSADTPIIDKRFEDRINLLLIDGQNGHDWKATSPVLKEMLLATGRFNVDVLTSPDKKAPKEEWDKFRPDFSKYAVVLTNYAGQPWPDEVAKAFEKYMTDGGGLLVYHFAVASFKEWDAYNRMIGMGWRDNKFGDNVALDDDGKVVRTPKGEGPGGSHGPAHPFEVMVRDKAHPITRGMPEKFPHVKDELYHGQRGPCQDMHILATAWDDPALKGTGKHEPMAWTVPFGKGRVFVTLLGHDGPATTDPASTAFLIRGAEWTATGETTVPLPKDLAAAPAAEAKKP